MTETAPEQKPPMDRRHAIATLLRLFPGDVTADAVLFYVKILEPFDDEQVQGAIETWGGTQIEKPLPAQLAQLCMNSGPSLDDMLRAFSTETGIGTRELKGPARAWHISHPRQKFMLRAYETRRPDGERKYSLPTIGRFLGNRDHTTILHGIRAEQARQEAAQ